MTDAPAKPPVTEPPEILYIDKKRVSCDGGGGALGHPRVYLEMGEEDRVECPYCDRLFVYKPE
jgi:uncharacterized Zn-finger protein